MKRRDAEQNIAHSLCLGSWSKSAIENALRRRLPQQLHRLVPEIADGLLAALPSQYAPALNSIAKALQLNSAFDRVLRYCERRNVWPDAENASPRMAPIPVFAHLDIPQLPTTETLSEWLMMPSDRLEYLADRDGRYAASDEPPVNHYRYFLQRKKAGGIRVIEAPKQALKTVQRKILDEVIDQVPNHKCAFGFVRGLNCLDGAARHAGERVVVCFDLKDFFPSIGMGRIFGLFRCLGYPHTVSQYLTALCTTATPQRILERLNYSDASLLRSPHLPQGSPVSPTLANKVAYRLDCRLSALARRLNANYSRYADDLTFSGDRYVSRRLLDLVPQIAREEGFYLNHAKTRVMPWTSRQVVTGVVVNERLNVTRKHFDHLKAVIFACGQAGDTRLDDPQFVASLVGQISWVETVNPNRGRKLRGYLQKSLTNP